LAITDEVQGQDTFWTPLINTTSYVEDEFRAIHFDTIVKALSARIMIGTGSWDQHDVYVFEAADSAIFDFNAARLGEFLHPEKAVSIGYKGDEILLDARSLNADPRNPLRYSLDKKDGDLIDAAPMSTWKIKSFDKKYLPKGTHTLSCINYKGCVVWSGEVVVD